MEKQPSYELKDYEILISDKFILDARKRINTRTEIYFGTIINSKEKIVFKLEPTRKYFYYDILENENKIKNISYLYKEREIYKLLEGIERIPKIYWIGTQGNYNCLVMELLGNSLNELMVYFGGKFSLGTTIKISVQILNIIKEIHKRGVVLRYLKPDNIVMGREENKDYVYLIDFEIAKRYIKNGKHIPYKEGKKVKGNVKFISVNTHCGKQISRRDDIECLGYNLIIFMKGRLPWSEKNKDKKIKLIKMNISLDELCEGLPEEFKEFINYAKNLDFEQEPDYSYLNGLLMKVAEKNGIDINNIKYDWDIKKEKENINSMNKEDNNKEKEKENKIKEIKEEEKNNNKNKEGYINDETDNDINDGRNDDKDDEEK